MSAHYKSFDFEKELKAFIKSGEKHSVSGWMIDSEVAAKLIEKYNYKGQRDIRPMNYGLIYEGMRRNTFPPYTNIHIAVLDGIPHVIDGQHRLRSMSACHGYEQDFTIHFEKVDTLKMLEARYGEFDKGAARTNGDVLGWLNDELGLKISKHSRRSVGTSASIIIKTFRVTGSSNDPAFVSLYKDKSVISKVVREFSSELKILFQAAPGASNPILKKLFHNNGSLIASSLIALRANRVEALEFIEGILLDDGLKAGCPRKAMVSYLLKKTNEKKSGVDDAQAFATSYFSYVQERKLNNINLGTQFSVSCLQKLRELTKAVFNINEI